MADSTELFDPQFLQRLRAMFMKLRKRRQLQKKGMQSTPAVGHTREFKDHRSYIPGDDFRSIDWRLFARLEKMFIRIFEQVQEFHVYIILDRSRSMIEPYGEKRIVGLQLAVALAYLGLLNEHRVSVLTLAEDVRRETPPLKGPGHIYNLLKLAGELEFGGVTDLTGALGRFRLARDRRGMVFVLSDLLGHRLGSADESITKVGSWPAETHVIHILHPLEIRPTLQGEVRLVEVETGQTRRIWMTRRDREAYVQAFARYQDALRRGCAKRKINYVGWTTDLAFEETFINLLSRGSALAGA